MLSLRVIKVRNKSKLPICTLEGKPGLVMDGDVRLHQSEDSVCVASTLQLYFLLCESFQQVWELCEQCLGPVGRGFTESHVTAVRTDKREQNTVSRCAPARE